MWPPATRWQHSRDSLCYETNGAPHARAERARITSVALSSNLKTSKRRSLREIAAELAQVGHLNRRGKPYAVQSVRMMMLEA
jgi:hypothetical protein